MFRRFINLKLSGAEKLKKIFQKPIDKIKKVWYNIDTK